MKYKTNENKKKERMQIAENLSLFCNCYKNYSTKMNGDQFTLAIKCRSIISLLNNNVMCEIIKLPKIKHIKY